MDYLIEEVLQHQPEVTRDFLLKTSILDWLSGPLCDALTGRKDGRETLERLEKENLFIIPLDRPYKWYRYEHIFAELLHHQLETTFSSEVIRDLHVRAGQWLEEHGLPDESVRHALEAREWERSARLICKYGREKARNGEFQTVYTWLRALPEEVRLASSEIRNLYFISASWVGKTKTAVFPVPVWARPITS